MQNERPRGPFAFVAVMFTVGLVVSCGESVRRVNSHDDPTGGGGGSAGCAQAELPQDSLAHCPTNPLEGGQPRSSCSLEATCDVLRCGDPWSGFDENGCRRLHCSSQADCAGTERCVPAVLGGHFDCYSSVYESCREYCGSCSCGWSDDCSTAAFCQPVAIFPHENDCRFDAEPCEALPDILWKLEMYAGGDYADDIEATLAACADRVATRIDECEGGGGAPGF
jgi:hypothetical protein